MIYIPISFTVSDFNLDKKQVPKYYKDDYMKSAFDHETFIYDIFYSNCGKGLIAVFPSYSKFPELMKQLQLGGD